MSEQRFVYEEEHFPIALTQIRDTLNNETYDLEECCELLNELATKCSRLAKEKDELSDDWSDKVGRLLDFVEEQGQVSRQQIKDWWNDE